MMNKHVIAAIAAAIMFGYTLPALAQQTPPQQPVAGQAQAVPPDEVQAADVDDAAATYNGSYGDPVCGAWQSGTWVSNNNCPGYAYGPHRARVAGTITAVKGHLVTLQLSEKSIVVNDQPALERETSGRVAVGRQIVAYGYWAGGTFYVTRFV